MKFHDKSFDESTKVKLAVFQGYIRAWLPVFLTSSKGVKVKSVNIFDFFSGPGEDSDGNPGSPLIIQDEIHNYCKINSNLRNDVPVNLIFNDIKKENIEKLKIALDMNMCEKSCCNYSFFSEDFTKLVQEWLPEMKKYNNANLVIMDQFGLKSVTPTIIKELLTCGKTDILFFISSSYIRRFIQEDVIKEKFNDIDPSQIKNIEYKTIHEYICEYYKNKLSEGYAFLAPFSIKKKANIYGIIFASKNLLGLEKFLEVCWKIDGKTGQANYSIENEYMWHEAGQGDLFEDDTRFTKIKDFEIKTIDYIRTSHPNNKQMYKFCLESGFSIPKANEILRKIQTDEVIKVINIFDNSSARKGAFFLNNNSDAKVRFEIS
jgi:three-Cys-motif partner protein